LDLTFHLDKNKFNVFALLPEEGPLSEKLRAQGTEVFILDYIFKILPGNTARFIKITKELLSIIRKNRIDIIHVNLHKKTQNFWLAFFLSGKPVIMNLRENVRLEIFEKLVINRFSRILCVSESIRQAFLKPRLSDILTRFDEKKMIVFYNGLDTERFKPGPVRSLRQELKAGDDEPLVGLIGAIDPVKGQDIFIQAARLVCDKYPKARFVMAGDLYAPNVPDKRKRAYKEGLGQAVKDFGFENNVFMLGFRDDIPQIMNSIDILVQPSSQEALGMALVEAMACEKPVIGTKVDGIPEVIGNEGAGILIDRTPEALAKAILFYLENPDESGKAGTLGRRRVKEMFDMKKNLLKLEGTYLQLNI